MSKKWRGRPRLDRVTVVNLIGNTTTKTGLTIKARLEDKRYEKGRKVRAHDMRLVNINRAPFHGEWTYARTPHAKKSTEIINA